MTAETQLRDYLRQMAAFRWMHGGPQEGFQYVSTEDYVLDRGVPAPSEPLADEDLDHLLAVAEAALALFNVQGFAQKQCFANAAMLALADDSQRLVYTEGYAQGRVMPVHHAWATLDGRVIDLTWRLDPAPADHRFGDRIVGVFPEGRTYRGIGFQTDHLRERVTDTGTFLSLIQDYQANYPLFREERKSPAPTLD